MARVSKRSECRASAPLQAFMSSCTRLDATPETYRDHARHNGVWGDHQGTAGTNRRHEAAAMLVQLGTAYPTSLEVPIED
jgi:hypothetical protein